MLLRNPELAWRLGRRGHRRLGRLFNESACIDGYRELLGALTGNAAEPPRRSGCAHDGADAGAAEARLLVEARLGRAPQDMLEAAVVLEAWAGVPAQTALAAASVTMPVEPASPQPSAGRLPRHREETACSPTARRSWSAWWRSPAGRRRWTSGMGVTAVEHGLALALPLTLALQRMLGSRFLDRPQGIAQLAPPPRAAAGGAVALCC